MRRRNSKRGFVHPSNRRSVMIELKSAKTRINDADVGIVCVCVCVGGERLMVEGVDGGYTPLLTRPQRYRDPASLVFISHESGCVKSVIKAEKSG